MSSPLVILIIFEIERERAEVKGREKRMHKEIMRLMENSIS